MSRWSSDSAQRRSKKYLAVIREFRDGIPAPHLSRLQPLPCFSISLTSDTDKITRHRIRSMGFKAHGE